MRPLFAACLIVFALVLAFHLGAETGRAGGSPFVGVGVGGTYDAPRWYALREDGQLFRNDGAGWHSAEILPGIGVPFAAMSCRTGVGGSFEWIALSQDGHCWINYDLNGWEELSIPVKGEPGRFISVSGAEIPMGSLAPQWVAIMEDGRWWTYDYFVGWAQGPGLIDQQGTAVEPSTWGQIKAGAR